MPKYIITESKLSNDALYAQNLVPVGQTKTSPRLGNPKYLYLPGLTDIDTQFGEISSQKPEDSILVAIREIQPGSHPEVVEIDDDELAGLLNNISIGGKKSRKSKTSHKSRKSKTSKKCRKSSKSRKSHK
jgi:hypothetical protein